MAIARTDRALATGDLLKLLNQRIATAAAEIVRIRAATDRDISELQAAIQQLQQAKANLTTDKESWLLDLLQSGVL